MSRRRLVIALAGVLLLVGSIAFIAYDSSDGTVRSIGCAMAVFTPIATGNSKTTNHFEEIARIALARSGIEAIDIRKV